MKFNQQLCRIGTKTWNYIKLAKIELIILASVLLLDLVVKAIVAGTMTVGESITVIPKFFNITFYLNRAAAFGFDFGLSKLFGLEATRIIFIIITFLATGLFCFLLYYFRKEHIVGRIGLALIISGAFGNLFDRIFIGAVRDFAEIVFFGLDIPLLGTSFAIFNIADMALVAGVIMFIVFFLFMYKPQPKDKVATADGEAVDNDENTDLSVEQKGDNDNLITDPIDNASMGNIVAKEQPTQSTLNQSPNPTKTNQSIQSTQATDATQPSQDNDGDINAETDSN